jgi:hypothetical protein
MVATAAHEISWKHEFDPALAEASRQGRPVLVDFTAAPM